MGQPGLIVGRPDSSEFPVLPKYEKMQRKVK